MKFRPIGIYTPGNQAPVNMRASDYSNDQYDGVSCGRDRKSRPVVIMYSKKEAPLRWMVVYGFSTVFFETFKDAIDFCRSRDVEILTEDETQRHV